MCYAKRSIQTVHDELSWQPWCARRKNFPQGKSGPPKIIPSPWQPSAPCLVHTESTRPLRSPEGGTNRWADPDPVSLQDLPILCSTDFSASPSASPVIQSTHVCFLGTVPHIISAYCSLSRSLSLGTRPKILMV